MENASCCVVLSDALLLFGWPTVSGSCVLLNDAVLFGLATVSGSCVVLNDALMLIGWPTVSGSGVVLNDADALMLFDSATVSASSLLVPQNLQSVIVISALCHVLYVGLSVSLSLSLSSRLCLCHGTAMRNTTKRFKNVTLTITNIVTCVAYL